MSARRVPGVTAPFLAGLVLFAVLAVVATAYLTRPRQVAAVPQSVLDARRESTVAAAQAVARSLNGGLSSMAAVATVVDESLRQRNRALLLPFKARMWKSLYVLDRTTRVVLTQVGETAQPAVLGEPLPLAAGLRLAQVGTTHQIVQYTPVGTAANSKYLLVGHLDPNRLADLLTVAGPEGAWLLDRAGTVIAGVGGGKQPPQGFTAPVMDAGENAAGSQIQRAGDRLDVIAWTSLPGRAPSNTLGWTVVSAKPATDIVALTDDSRHRGVKLGRMLAALIVVVFAALYLMVLRPLRRLRQLAGEPGQTAPAPKYGEAGAIARTFTDLRRAQSARQPEEVLAGER